MCTWAPSSWKQLKEGAWRKFPEMSLRDHEITLYWHAEKFQFYLEDKWKTTEEHNQNSIYKGNWDCDEQKELEKNNRGLGNHLVRYYNNSNWKYIVTQNTGQRSGRTKKNWQNMMTPTCLSQDNEWEWWYH